MHRPRPSAPSFAAILGCHGKTVSTAALARGEWIEHNERLPGYAVNQLLLAFADGTSLLLWSDQVDYGPEPWHEAFVLAAEALPINPDPLSVRNAGAPRGFEIAPPLQAVFAGQRLECIEMFIRLSDVYTDTTDEGVVSDSLRLRAGEHVVELATEGRDVVPLSLVLRSSGFPLFTSKATGERELLSRQHVRLERPSNPPPGDA